MSQLGTLMRGGNGGVRQGLGRGRTIFLLVGLLAAALPASVAAQTVPAVPPSSRDPYGDPITEAVQRFSLPEAWIRAVMQAESDGDPLSTSPKGAMGLMQIMPETWTELRARYHLGTNPYDPHDNIIAGSAYIREMFDRYGSPGWIAAYNAGPDRYEASLKGRPLPAETRAYVATVLPVIGGGRSARPIVVATADPLAWTRAPLFIVLPWRTSATGSASVEQPPSDALTASPAHDISVMVPRSGDLFMARAGTGLRP